MPTPYAVQQGELESDDNGACLWWLRAPGDDLYDATYAVRGGSCGNSELQDINYEKKLSSYAMTITQKSPKQYGKVMPGRKYCR